MGSTFIPFNVEPSERFKRLHRLSAGLHVAYGANDREQIEELSFEIEKLNAEILARPVLGIVDLLDRAALVLFWGDGGLLPNAWADPVEHLTEFVPNENEDGQAIAAAHLAASVFQLAGVSIGSQEARANG
ncbi:hypothetical protein APY04_3094 [Hyphomicrobium sulfonivorans]|uniref:Uncharacterized protein n=1 Tax=Hyphomicrobium sulfonivorans TaxID=121290 RepID=A0A109BA48_HYPSL|nr:hypothetical protein [Hyphomicrobium sulfonivorans]KWT64854.1 hypothetical protein APY04_3094 [Hyphomicrobium sulfonivorans]